MIERPALILFLDRPVAAIQESHIAAKRNGRNTILSLILAGNMCPDWLAETDRESQHFHAGPATHNVVAKLMHGNQDADRNDER